MTDDERTKLLVKQGAGPELLAYSRQMRGLDQPADPDPTAGRTIVIDDDGEVD